MDLSDLPARLRRHNKSQADLARHLGLDPSSLTKTIKGERQLKAAELLKIEEFFAGSGFGGVEDAPRAYRGAHRPAQRRVPIYGYSAGDGQRVIMAPGQEAETLDLPSLEAASGDLFGVRAVGETMEPRYFEGEIAIAQIGLPPAKDRDCIIELRDGTALLKLYCRQRAGRVFYRDFGEDAGQEKSLDATSVKALHSVLRRL